MKGEIEVQLKVRICKKTCNIYTRDHMIVVVASVSSTTYSQVRKIQTDIHNVHYCIFQL